jgi:hypothetical protein
MVDTIKWAMIESVPARIACYVITLVIGCTLIFVGVMAPSRFCIRAGVLFLVAVPLNILAVYRMNKRGWGRNWERDWGRGYWESDRW